MPPPTGVRRHLLRQDFDLSGVPVLQIENRQFQGGEGGVVGDAPAGEFVPGLAHGGHRLFPPAQAGRDQAFQPAQPDSVQILSEPLGQDTHLGNQRRGFVRPAQPFQVNEDVVVETEEVAGIGFAAHEGGGLSQRRKGSFEVAHFFQGLGFLDQDSACRAPFGQRKSTI